MPGGLWVPGAVWEFRQNLRSLPTTGVQVVQSSTEPTTWQWEYTIQTDDLPLVDTVGRGDVPPDLLYGCTLSFEFTNNSGASQSYYFRVEVQSQTLGTFQSDTAFCSNVANNYTVYFGSSVHSVGVGTTLRARLWGSAAHNVSGIKLILVPIVTPPGTDVLLLEECVYVQGTPNVYAYQYIVATSVWDIAAFYPTNPPVSLNSIGYAAGLLLMPVNTATWRGGMVSWLGSTNYGSMRSVIVSGVHSTAPYLYPNGFYGVYDSTFRLLDVRFGHLFRNLKGVSKF
jgi:hypothetical protein